MFDTRGHFRAPLATTKTTKGHEKMRRERSSQVGQGEKKKPVNTQQTVKP